MHPELKWSQSILMSCLGLVIEENFVTLSVNFLQSLKSVCTDSELATYIKVTVTHFIYNLNVFSDGQLFLCLIH